MKKMTILAAFMGLALVFGSAVQSEAGCFIGCGGDDESIEQVGGDKVGGDKFEKLAETITDSPVITGGSQNANIGHAHVGDVSGAAAKVDIGSTNTLGTVDKSHDNQFNINSTTNVGNKNKTNN